MKVVPVGPAAALVEFDDATGARSLAAFARESDLAVLEVVPAARTVLFDGLADVDALHALLGRWPGPQDEPSGGLVEVAVRYDGPDLDRVAELWGTDADGVVRLHAGLEFVSSFCGFAPGFAYLAGLPDERAVPRLDSPRTTVPAGSVALAGTWCGVYPTASPGGWQVIGATDAPLWDADRDPPALLAPGTRVRFVVA